MVLWIPHFNFICLCEPIGSMYGIYANIGGILMVNVTIYSIHGSYGIAWFWEWIERRNLADALYMNSYG